MNRLQLFHGLQCRFQYTNRGGLFNNTLGGVCVCMFRKLKTIVKFAIVMFAMAIACEIIWDEFVAQNLYDCTDALPFGYFSPGHWVHVYHGVVYVPHVTHDHSMSDPDSLKQGWSVTGLWCLWCLLFGISTAVSCVLACLRWTPSSTTPSNQSLEPSAVDMVNAASRSTPMAGGGSLPGR